MRLIEKLEADILNHKIQVPQKEWDHLQQLFQEENYSKKTNIFSQTDVCENVLFIADGIAASEYILEDGRNVITRFFQKNDFCSNIVSAKMKDLASDNIIAITDVSAISISYDVFIQYYLKRGKFGEYLRTKFINIMIEDKHYISVKTISNTELKYQFLEKEYPDIIRLAPDKAIAAFIGITPEGFSRFLKNRKKS